MSTLVHTEQAPASRVAPGAVFRLAWVEGWRLLRTPWFLVVCSFSALLWLFPLRGEEPEQTWPTQNITILPIYPGPWLAAASTVAAAFFALRDCERTTGELFRSVPATRVDRVLGLALVGVIPISIAAATMAGVSLLVRDFGGITTGDVNPVQVQPSASYLAVPVLTVGVSWAIGIALAYTVALRVFAVVVAVVGTFFGQFVFWLWAWFPAYFLMPYATPLTYVDLGTSHEPREWAGPIESGQHSMDGHWHGIAFQEDRHLWHHCYMLGASLLLIAYACWRSGPDRRTRWIAAGGAILAIAGFVGQVLTWGGAIHMFGQTESL